MKNEKIQNYHTVLPEIKMIYDDCFLYKKEGSLIKLYDYINSFYEEIIPDPNKRPEIITRKGEQFGKMKAKKDIAEFNTHHLLFNLETKDNLLTYYLTNPDFEVSSSQMYKLNKTHPNWYHENKEGITPLSALYARGDIDVIDKICSTMNLKFDIKNKHNEYPSFSFFKDRKYFKAKLDHFLYVRNNDSQHFYRTALNEIYTATKILEQQKEIYDNCSLRKFQMIRKSWDEKFDIFFSANEKLKTEGVGNPLMQYQPRFTDMINIKYSDLSKNLDQIILSRHLEKPSTPISRNKI